MAITYIAALKIASALSPKMTEAIAGTHGRGAGGTCGTRAALLRRGLIRDATFGHFTERGYAVAAVLRDDLPSIDELHTEALAEDARREVEALRAEAKQDADPIAESVALNRFPWTGTSAEYVARTIVIEKALSRAGHCANRWHDTAPARARGRMECFDCRPEAEQVRAWMARHKLLDRHIFNAEIILAARLVDEIDAHRVNALTDYVEPGAVVRLVDGPDYAYRVAGRQIIADPWVDSLLTVQFTAYRIGDPDYPNAKAIVRLVDSLR